MNKKDWKSAPEWAMYRAGDCYGRIFWYEKQPIRLGDFYIWSFGKYQIACELEPHKYGKCRNFIEQRPDEKQRKFIRMPIIRVTVGRDSDEPTKAVLPTIIFLNTNHESFGELRMPGFLVGIGWWDYSVKLFVIFKNK